jgi:low affinity Fe/Cu permease
MIQAAGLKMAKKNRKNDSKGFLDWFTDAARAISWFAGTPWAFLLALAFIFLWLASGPIFKYSDTWQLVINTGTTIITFLMVFVIQNAQNRDSKSIELKLDELLKDSNDDYANEYIKIEDLSEEEIKMLGKRFEKIKNYKKKKS